MSRRKRLSLRPKCTCRGVFGGRFGRHYLSCDLMYRHNSWPKKRKRFFIFYPLKPRR